MAVQNLNQKAVECSLVILTDSEVEQPDVNLSSKEEANDINNEEAEEDLESNPENGNVKI